MYKENIDKSFLTHPFFAFPSNSLLFICVKKSELKTITKCILKEIYQDPSTYSFQSAADVIKRQLYKNYPAISNPSAGHKAAHDLIDASSTLVKFMFFSILKHDKENTKETGEKILYTYEILKNILGKWLEKIFDSNDEEKQEKAKIIVEEFSNHFQQLINQINTIQLSLASGNEGSLIGASRQIEHLNEIFKSIKNTIDDFFELTLNNK